MQYLNPPLGSIFGEIAEIPLVSLIVPFF